MRRFLSVALRAALILLLALLVVRLGIALAPWLPWRAATESSHAKPALAKPDWGGGELSFATGSAADIADSVRKATGMKSRKTQESSGPGYGVVLRQKGAGTEASPYDYDVTLALSSRDEPGRTAVFELPSSNRFRKQLFPNPGDAQAPARDIPLYPGSSCRTQLGAGTDCFVGFYLTPDSIEAVRSFFVRALSQSGWERVTTDRGRETEDRGPSPVSRLPSPVLETFAKSDEGRTVIVQLRKQDSATTRIGLVATTQASPDQQ